MLLEQGGLSMKILHRYILKEVIWFFFGVLAVFTGMLLTVRMLKFAFEIRPACAYSA